MDGAGLPAGTSVSSPRKACSITTAAAAAQACGRQDAGYGTGTGMSSIAKPPNSSGNRPSKAAPAANRPPANRAACSVKPALINPCTAIAVSCGQTDPAVVTQRRGRCSAGKLARGGIRNRDALAGWLFMAPAVIVVVIFVLLPVISALWVSVSDWTGKGSPLKANFIGVDNYQALLTKPGLAQRDLAMSLRNNLYYVLLVVPLQTILALLLATTLNRRRLRGKGFSAARSTSRR